MTKCVNVPSTKTVAADVSSPNTIVYSAWSFSCASWMTSVCFVASTLISYLPPVCSAREPRRHTAAWSGFDTSHSRVAVCVSITFWSCSGRTNSSGSSVTWRYDTWLQHFTLTGGCVYDDATWPYVISWMRYSRQCVILGGGITGVDNWRLTEWTGVWMISYEGCA